MAPLLRAHGIDGFQTTPSKRQRPQARHAHILLHCGGAKGSTAHHEDLGRLSYTVMIKSEKDAFGELQDYLCVTVIKCTGLKDLAAGDDYMTTSNPYVKLTLKQSDGSIQEHQTARRFKIQDLLSQKELLEVKNLSRKGLSNNEADGLSDPFVKVSLHDYVLF